MITHFSVITFFSQVGHAKYIRCRCWCIFLCVGVCVGVRVGVD